MENPEYSGGSQWAWGEATRIIPGAALAGLISNLQTVHPSTEIFLANHESP